jgi:hypothetical protein
MTFPELVKRYQGRLSLREYAYRLGVVPSVLCNLYGGKINFSAGVLWGLLTLHPEAAAELPRMATIYSQVV